jgi:hypothetical protein
MKFEFYRQFFEKYLNIKFYENSSVGQSCSVRTDGRTDGETDMMKLIVTFRNFANAPQSLVYAKPRAALHIKLHCSTIPFNCAIGPFHQPYIVPISNKLNTLPRTSLVIVQYTLSSLIFLFLLILVLCIFFFQFSFSLLAPPCTF